MVDDYSGYKALFAKGVTELGCRAHARRKFFDAHAGSGNPVAKEAIGRIDEIYATDAALCDLDSGERYRERQSLLAPKLAVFNCWLDEMQPKVLGNTGLTGAIGYTQNRWNALARVADDGRYPIANNPAENIIRPIAIGRKNWLFAGSESAGQRVAAIMRLLATAKINGLDPYPWPTDVLTRLPTTLDKHLDSLLPTSWYCPIR